MKKALALTLLFTTTACVGGGGPVSSTLAPSAAEFTYTTPVTRLNLGGDLTLLRCDTDQVLVASTLTLAASAGVDQSASFTLRGASLMSAMERRELAIELYDNRTIKSVNATSTDRTGAVITNVLRTIGSVAGVIVGLAAPGAAPPPAPPASLCNPETTAALRQARAFRASLESLRASLVGAAPQDVEAIGARMELIGQQLALLVATKLTISVSRPLTVGDNPTPEGQWVPVRWTLADLERWFGGASASTCSTHSGAPSGLFVVPAGKSACEAETPLFAVSYRISAPAGEVAEAGDRVAASACRTPTPELVAECGRTIVMPRPARAAVRFRADSDNFVGQPRNAVLGQAGAAIPQWGPATYLALNVRTFQSRTVGFTVDPFGQRQSLKWNSEATADNATSAIASIAEAGANTITAIEGQSDTARLNAESAELEARMKRNRLRVCEQQILAGVATSCD